MRKRVLAGQPTCVHVIANSLSEQQADPVVPHHKCRQRQQCNVGGQEGGEERVDGDVKRVRKLDTVVGNSGHSGRRHQQPVGGCPEEEGNAQGEEDEVTWVLGLPEARIEEH